MECRENKELISAYVDGEASPEDSRRIAKHMEECAQCRADERMMRSLGVGVARIEADVPPEFRENLFARLEKEELVPKRRSLFVFSLRWAAIPLAVAAAVGLVMLTTRDRGPMRMPPTAVPQVAQRTPASGGGEAGLPTAPGARRSAVPSAGVTSGGADDKTIAAQERGTQKKETASARGPGAISAEDREVIAHLDFLEDPAALEDVGDFDEMEMFAPSGNRKG